MSKLTYNSWEEVPNDVVVKLLKMLPFEEDEDCRKWLAEQLGLRVEQVPPGEINQW